ncbi:hypothetical protein ACWJJH_04245 [Endozoicomonadaceae bacterium StTr2]
MGLFIRLKFIKAITKVFCLAIFTSLTACSSLPTANVPSGGTIVIVFEAPDYICHNHTGFTVFNNFIKYYEVPSEDLEAAVVDGYRQGFEQAGYNLVRKKPKDLFGPDERVRAHITQLSSRQLKNLQSAVKNDDITLVLYENPYASVDNFSNTVPSEIHNYCEGNIIFYTGVSLDSVTPDGLAYSGDTTAFEVATGKNLGRLHYHEDPEFLAMKPADLKKLSQDDINRFLADLTKNARFKAGLIVQNFKPNSAPSKK